MSPHNAMLPTGLVSANCRSHTSDSTRRLPAFEGQSPTLTDAVQFLMEHSDVGDRVLGTAGKRRPEQSVDALRVDPRQHRLATSRRMSEHSAADAGRERRGESSADLVEIDALASVEHRQVNDHAGLQVQFVQKRCSGFADLAVAAVATTEAERATPEAVAERCVIDQSSLTS